MSKELSQLRENPLYKEWIGWANEWLERHDLTFDTGTDEEGDLSVRVLLRQYEDLPVVAAHYTPPSVKFSSAGVQKPITTGKRDVDIFSTFGDVHKKIETTGGILVIEVTGEKWLKLDMAGQASAISFAQVQSMLMIFPDKLKQTKSDFLEGYYSWLKFIKNGSEDDESGKQV
jgi:hypothetical protein